MKKNTYKIEKAIGSFFRIYNEKFPNNTVGIVRIKDDKPEVYDDYTIPVLRNKHSDTMANLIEEALTM